MNARSRPVVVAVATPLPRELLAELEAVDDRLEVRYQPDLPAALDDAEVMFGIPHHSPDALADLIASNANLRWVQVSARDAGKQLRAVDLTRREFGRVLITRTGVHTESLAEFALSGILAFAKSLPSLLQGAKEQSWDRVAMSQLSGQTLLVVGLGPTGMDVARLGGAFGMRVLGVNRTGRGTIAGVELVRPPRFLDDLLPTAHAIVVTLPVTEQTKGMIDAHAISRMRKDSVFVNVGSGGVVDEQALAAGLEQGQPAAAVLDRFAIEPLPADSPLWRLPNVLISPHSAAWSDDEHERMVTFFIRNLRRYLRGDDLVGVVDTATLY